MKPSILDRAGILSGLALSPFVTLLSASRGGRFLHPRGVVLEGEARALVREGPLGTLAQRLEGPLLVRFSGAWWKQREWKDVLGCALRFRATHDGSPQPAYGDQDLLFATIRRVVTLPFAPLSTRQHDFLANDYYAITPFRAPPLARVWFRLRGPGPVAAAPNRTERLLSRLRAGPVALTLEARVPGSDYRPLLHVLLTQPVSLDEVSLRFDPFRSGRDVHPAGYVHHLRRFAYPAGRALHAARRAAASRPGKSSAASPNS
jgi:hypothetical protein